MQLASRKVAVCKNRRAVRFPAEVSAGGKCLDLTEQSAPQPPGTPLAEGTNAAPSRVVETTWPTETFMSMLTVKGNWNIARGKLKQKLAQLANDDLQFIDGKEDELVGRIQKRAGRAKMRDKRALDECCGCHRG
jgi:uncharacterized protein YjbJ (UPF0337 family)